MNWWWWVSIGVALGAWISLLWLAWTVVRLRGDVEDLHMCFHASLPTPDEPAATSAEDTKGITLYVNEAGALQIEWNGKRLVVKLEASARIAHTILHNQKAPPPAAPNRSN